MTRLWLLVAFAGCSAQSVIEVEGFGSVFGPDQACIGPQTCAFDLRKPVALSAAPVEGWAFAGWAGDCLGDAGCKLQIGGHVGATFLRLPLNLRIEGPGQVEASDGRVCAESICRWEATTPITLKPVPATSAAFVGFTGNCAAPDCTTQFGEVTAHFVTTAQVRIDILGTGSARVTLGAQSCTSSCTIEVPSSEPYELTVTPGPRSLPPVVAGACTTNPCIIAAPARVEVHVEAARLLSIRMEGAGRGALLLGNDVLCASPASLCEHLISADQPSTLSTRTADDYQSFLGFTGACEGADCVLAPGQADVSLTARFEPVLLWHRSLDAEGQALLADRTSLVAAVFAAAPLIADGVSYGVPTGAAPEFLVLTEFNWDGGLDWVRALNQHQVGDGNQKATITSLIRRGNGGIYAAGNCQLGRLNGSLDCTRSLSPLMISLDARGAIESLETSPGAPDDVASWFDLTDFGDRRFVIEQSGLLSRSARLGWHDDDGGFRVVSNVPGLSSGNTLTGQSSRHCVEQGGRLVCAFSLEGGLSLDACSALSPPGERIVLLEFDSELRCVAATSLINGGAAVSGLSAFDGGILSAGYSLSTPFDFGGLTSQVGGAWIAESAGTRVVRLGVRDELTPRGPGRVSQVLETTNGVLVQYSVAVTRGSRAVLYGSEYTRPSIAMHLVSRGDLTTPQRRWVFTDANDTIPQVLISATGAYAVDGRIALLVSGVDVRFGDTPLSSDGRRHTHVVVLRE